MRGNKAGWTVVMTAALMVVGASSYGENAFRARNRPSSGEIRARLREKIAEKKNRGESRQGDKGSIEVGGRTRTYLLHLPRGYNRHKTWPMVIVLHGGGASAENGERMTGMSEKADKEGFIAVYPDGTGQGSRRLTWNVGDCCGYAVEQGVDDVGFIRALIGKLKAERHVDPDRIYATGMSNGGMLTYRLACELSDEFAAVGVVSGSLNGECRPSRAVPIVIFHGTADQHVPYAGGYGSESPVQRLDKPVASAVSFWVANNRCRSTPKWTASGSIVQTDFTGCRNGADVSLYSIKGEGHTWPGGEEGRRHGNVDPPTKEISATEVLWDFFQSHPMR
ncbi:MAG: prolyl oligopeptidase family serine peptidase [Elusimicrobia bacterium]|nr:prolyl oligopeptidase family serine peptidase [Elusimicrobiota bacterium]